MIKTFVTGFSRIGEQRELKFALEKFWQNKDEKESFDSVEIVAKELRKRHWNYQKDAGIDYISSNDFSFYDTMLDTMITFDAIPESFKDLSGTQLYFALARGAKDHPALAMTKWFNTNYHYIVPEISSSTKFKLNSKKIIDEFKEAKELGITTKINLIGPITFLALSKSTDSTCPLNKLDELVAEYEKLLKEISAIESGVVVQFDEPIFVTSKGQNHLNLLSKTYSKLSQNQDIKVLFMTYFEHANEAVKELLNSGVWGVGLDFVHGQPSCEILDSLSKTDIKLFAGVIDGRNIWRSGLTKKLELVEKLQAKFGEDLVVGTSCSLLHVPVSLKYEEKLNDELKSWLSFAVEKLDELKTIKALVSGSCQNAKKALEDNKSAIAKKEASPLLHNKAVEDRVATLTKFERELPYEKRVAIQKDELNLPPLPTTTIGSFPQTTELRQTRNAYKKSLITKADYGEYIKKYIKECVAFQEEVGLDVLVHGEPERNDMVEYFGEQLDGFAFSQNGWVQSYGSRCVKPPLIYADVSRPKAMTVEWITYAASLTDKIMKGMLTGPVTILNWSFVRDDKPRDEVATQIALAISDEIDDLQNAGIKIVQVDEAAFKEGYPLRDENIKFYEEFAVNAFRLSVSSANPKTSIHTHMCYSEFNDIIHTIEAMGADVISIETARAGNKLLEVFKRSGYKAQVGPGIYDIHSPRVPSVEEMVKQIDAILEVLPREQLWINPDCGLKTRKWEEVRPALKNMVEATKIARV